MERRINGYTHYTTTWGIWIGGLRLHALRAIIDHANDFQKSTQTTRQRHRKTKTQRHRHIILIGPHWGPLDLSVEINTSWRWNPTMVNVIVIVIISSIKTIEYKYKIRKSTRTTGQMDGCTDWHIILPLGGFEPVASVCMRWTQLRAVRFDWQKPTRTTRQRENMRTYCRVEMGSNLYA